MADDETRPEDGRLALLADGTLGLRLPDGWRVGQHGFAAATLLPDALEHAALRVEVASFEDHAAAAGDDFSRFLDKQAQALCRASQLSGSRGFIVKGSATDGSSGAHRQVWRVFKSLYPEHIRVATYTLDIPLSEAASPRVSTLTEEVERLVENAAFAGGLTALDRIAPTEHMKRISFWNRIHMRVPGEWRFVREGDSESHVYRGEPEREAGRCREAFWVDFEEFRRQPAAQVPTQKHGRQIIEELSAGVISQLTDARRDARFEFLADGNGLLSYRYDRRREDGPKRVFRWFRFADVRRRLIMAMFSFAVPDDGHDGRALAARAALVDREIRNAVITDPGSGPGA